MFLEVNDSDAISLLFPIDVKFLKTFQKNTDYFGPRCKICHYFDNMFTIDLRRYTAINHAQLSLQTDYVPLREHSLFQL
jgi:hypothetical protein